MFVKGGVVHGVVLCLRMCENILLHTVSTNTDKFRDIFVKGS